MVARKHTKLEELTVLLLSHLRVQFGTRRKKYVLYTSLILFLSAFPCPPAVAELGSDEDDLDEEGQEYLEMLARKAGEDGDDEDWEEDDAEETALEGFTTSVDDEDNLVDEYQIFKAILQSEWSQTLPLPTWDTSGHLLISPPSPPIFTLQISRPEIRCGTRR